MKKSVLFVDDEANILEGLRRMLRSKRGEWDMVFATNGAEALESMREKHFDVVVSDMRMPGMDGIHLLAQAKAIAPDSVRIMLTGAGDQQTAIHAVNEGNIFRFLSKPCAAEALAKALQAGIDQYRLITAERELLEKTLKGSIKALVDILALTNPVAFSRAMRLRYYAVQIARRMNIPDIWQIEVAAMLSQVGCVTIPGETLEKAFAGETLTGEKEEMFNTHPQVGGQLIVNIPRLDTIATMITRQHNPPTEKIICNPEDKDALAVAGAQILKVVVDFDLLLGRGLSPENSCAKLESKPQIYPSYIVQEIHHIDIPMTEKTSRMVDIGELRNGMILAEDIQSKNGILVVGKNQQINNTLRLKLKNFSQQKMISDQIRVIVFQRNVSEANLYAV
jgi:CheY-like chemotaxis protein